MIQKITFDRTPGDFEASTLTIQIGSPVFRLPLTPSWSVTVAEWGASSVRKETREDYDRRLARAAHDFGRAMEREMIAKLKEMGHLAN